MAGADYEEQSGELVFEMGVTKRQIQIEITDDGTYEKEEQVESSTCCSLLTTHYSLLTTHDSRLTTHDSLPTTCYSARSFIPVYVIRRSSASSSPTSRAGPPSRTETRRSAWCASSLTTCAIVSIAIVSEYSHSKYSHSK